MSMSRAAALTLIVITGLVSGCAKPAATTPTDTKVSADGNHDGWWCDEHGVPEEVCALCDARLVADFKAKGDWCKQHDRPESQCFICHSERAAEFAAQYEAKYGKQPPPREGEEQKTPVAN
jgi:hypothetical protein